MYKLTEIIKQFGLRIDCFSEFWIIYDELDIEKICSKLKFLQWKAFSPETFANMRVLKDIDAERLSEYKGENHWKKFDFLWFNL